MIILKIQNHHFFSAGMRNLTTALTCSHSKTFSSCEWASRNDPGNALLHWQVSPVILAFFPPKSEFQNYIDTFPVTQAVKFSVWAWIVFHCKWWDITEVEIRENDYPNFGICLSLWLIPETLQMCSCYKIFYDAAPASLQGVRFLKGSEREILERESAIK